MVPERQSDCRPDRYLPDMGPVPNKLLPLPSCFADTASEFGFISESLLGPSRVPPLAARRWCPHLGTSRFLGRETFSLEHMHSAATIGGCTLNTCSLLLSNQEMTILQFPDPGIIQPRLLPFTCGGFATLPTITAWSRNRWPEFRHHHGR